MYEQDGNKPGFVYFMIFETSGVVKFKITIIDEGSFVLRLEIILLHSGF